MHAMVAGVLDTAPDADAVDRGDGDDGGMASLLAAIERLPADVGSRLVRAYLAAVME